MTRYERATLFRQRPIQRFKNDGDQIVALGAFDLFEGLNIIVFGAVHDGKNFRDEMSFVSGPLATGTSVERLQKNLVVRRVIMKPYRPCKIKL